MEIPAGFTDTVTGLKDQTTTVMTPTIGDSVSEQIMDKIFVGFSDGAEKARGGLGTAIEGATKLQGGLAALQGATVQMGDGAGRLAGGVDKLTGPVTGALDQLPEAHAIADQLTNTPVGQVVVPQDGPGTLVAGTATLRDGTQRLVAGSRQLADRAVRLDEGAGTLSPRVSRSGATR